MNGNFWLDSETYIFHQMEIDEPWASYQDEVHFIIMALMGMRQ